MIMKQPYVPPEFSCTTEDDKPAIVRYDVDYGEEQWFDARAGVGSPGYPGGVAVTEVKVGDGQWTDDLDQFDPDWVARVEADIETMLTEREQEHYEP